MHHHTRRKGRKRGERETRGSRKERGLFTNSLFFSRWVESDDGGGGGNSGGAAVGCRSLLSPFLTIQNTHKKPKKNTSLRCYGTGIVRYDCTLIPHTSPYTRRFFERWRANPHVHVCPTSAGQLGTLVCTVPESYDVSDPGNCHVIIARLPHHSFFYGFFQTRTLTEPRHANVIFHIRHAMDDRRTDDGKLPRSTIQCDDRHGSRPHPTVRKIARRR